MIIKIIALFSITFVLFLSSGIRPWLIFSLFSEKVKKNYFIRYAIGNIKVSVVVAALIAFSSVFYFPLLEIDLMTKEGNVLFFLPEAYKVIMLLLLIVNTFLFVFSFKLKKVSFLRFLF